MTENALTSTGNTPGNGGNTQQGRVFPAPRPIGRKHHPTPQTLSVDPYDCEQCGQRICAAYEHHQPCAACAAPQETQ